MADDVGTRISHIAGDDSESDRTIVSSGESVKVLGILVANTDDAAEDTVTLTDSAGNTLLTIEVGPNNSEDFAAHWITSNGLTAVSAAGASTTFITVVWRPGA